MLLIFCSFHNGLKAAFIPKFINYCEEQGLCNQEVYDVICDKTGLIWIATDNGVFNYDGEVFNHFNKSDGLTDNAVYKIIEDDVGKLWMMTGNKKLCYYTNKKLYPYPFNNLIKEYLPSGSDLMEISYHSKTGLKLAVNHGGFLSIDNQGKSYFYGSSKTQINKKECGLYLLKDQNQILSFQYYNSKSCLSLLDSIPLFICHTNTKNEIEVSDTFYLNSLYTNQKVLSVKRGCSLADGSIAQIWHNSVYIIRENTMQRILLNQSIIMLREIEDVLWIGTRKGIYTYNLLTDELKYEDYLCEYSVSSVAKDLDGGYWFTTLEKGLFYTPNLLLTHQELSKGGKITADIVKNDNRFIISYRDGQIDEFDPESEQTTTFIYPENKSSNLFGLAIDSKKRIYTGGTEVICYNENTPKKINSTLDFTKKMLRHKEDIFIVSKRNLYRIKNDLTTTTYPIDLQDITGLSIIDESIYVLCESKSFVFQILPDTLIQSETRILQSCIHVWKTESIINGMTRDGRLVHFNQKTNEFSQSYPLLNDWIVNDVLVTPKVTWIASNQGIIGLTDNLEQPIIQIGEAQGLASVNVRRLEIMGDHLYYLTKNNLGKIQLPIEMEFKGPQIKGLRFESSTQTYANVPAEIVLPESDNEFNIYPIYISYNQPQNIVFHYQLVGANKKMSKTPVAKIPYSGLSSGVYDFYLTATVNNINFSDPVRFRLIIESPFWKKGWFLILATLSLIVVFLLIGLLIIKRIRKKAALKLEMVELRSKALGAQMNPHFMFNFLNSLQLKIVKNETEDAINYLGEFCGLVRKNLNYSNENHITLTQEVELSRSYLYLEKIRYKDGLEFSIEITPDLNLSKFNVPPLLLQPFIENAIIHGFSQKKDTGIITIQISPLQNNKNAVIISIKDNGCGLKKEWTTSHKSLGIALIRQRIMLQNPNNSLSINSKPNAGTEVVLKLYKLRH